MAPRHWIVAFRKHVLPMLHIPRPGNRGGEFVATFPSVPCSGCGLAFPLRVGFRRVSVSGREVKAGEKVVGQLQEYGCWGQVWLRGGGWGTCLAVVLSFLFFPMPRILFVYLSLPPRFLPFSCCLFCWNLLCNRGKGGRLVMPLLILSSAVAAV